MNDRLSIVEYRDDLASLFRDINAAWIRSMYVLEPHDIEVLENPRAHIIDPGGQILFVVLDGRIVGAGALMPVGGGAVELTKMGVLDEARGQKAGEYLLAALIERGRSMRPSRLFLLTNRKSQAAIHLYEKLGFVHDHDVMAAYGASYDRCDVAMNYPL
jgi:ribosomal protein S18 acetylase RimI-like enzyme